MNLQRAVNEKILLIEIIGVLEAMALGKVSIDESEKFLFSPFMVKQMRGNQCNEKIICILERGCELEDIASLLPQSLLKNIRELKLNALEVLGEYPEFSKKIWSRSNNDTANNVNTWEW